MVAEMKRSSKVRLPDAKVETIARRFFPEHPDMMLAGYRLAASSGVWASRGGQLTLRLVYRRRAAGTEATHSYSWTGIAI